MPLKLPQRTPPTTATLVENVLNPRQKIKEGQADWVPAKELERAEAPAGQPVEL